MASEFNKTKSFLNNKKVIYVLNNLRNALKSVIVIKV